MSACEKCWRDANVRALTLGGSVADHYRDLLEERRDRPCSEAEQRGDEIPNEHAKAEVRALLGRREG